MNEDQNTNTPAAGEATQPGDSHGAAGQGGKSGEQTAGLDVNALRDQIEAELRDSLRREIEADVKRKLANEITKAREQAQNAEQADELKSQIEALEKRNRELEERLQQLVQGQEQSRKRDALRAALSDLVSNTAFANLLVGQFEGRVQVKSDQIIPLTADGKPDLIVRSGKAVPRDLRDWLRIELQQSGFEELLKPSVRGGADSQSSETTAPQATDPRVLFGQLLRS